jgi:hypothetical protein
MDMRRRWKMVIVSLVTLLLVVPVGLSYVVEGLRSAPVAPTRLSWAPEIPIRYVNVNGVTLRYVKVGQGPPLVLLHTLRTQLDMFQKDPSLQPALRGVRFGLPRAWVLRHPEGGVYR